MSPGYRHFLEGPLVEHEPCWFVWHPGSNTTTNTCAQLKETDPPTIDTTKLLTSSRSGPPLSFGRLQASFTPVPTNRCTASGRKYAADFGLCTGCSRSGSQLLPLRVGRWSSTGGPGSIGALDREPISYGGPHSWGHAQKLGTNMRRNMKEP